MGRRTILVIEDDAAIRNGILDALKFHGYETIFADDGKKGLESALSADYDLLLLDLMLPRIGGLEILESLRKTRPTVPVVILTAKGEEQDRVKGLKLGADDYMVKPFSVKELMARIEAVLRRSPERPGDVKTVKMAGLTIDLARCEVRLPGGKRSELSEREAELVRYLAANPGRTITRDEILSRVWRLDPKGVETRTIDMHIARLREKLGDDPENPRVILTVRGRGYMLGPTEMET
jgi:DNA-binding response OmpR family regulator